MLSFVEIGPGYLAGSDLGMVEIEPGYGVHGAGMGGYDDVTLVGSGMGAYDDVQLVGYDDVQLVGAWGEGEPFYKKPIVMGGIAAGVLAVALGGYFLYR